MPNDGDNLTKDQVEQSLNIDKFPKWEVARNWHIGQFEPWALEFGYQDGMPIYGGITVDGKLVHVYYLNDGHKLPIILRLGETPATYGIKPKQVD